MANLDEPTVKASVGADTAQLFSAYCHNERRSNRISDEGIEQYCPRTRAWFEALERGEFTPTVQMAAEMDSALDRCGSKSNLRHTLIELELEPYGLLAPILRDQFKLPAYSPAKHELPKLVGQGISPIATSIRERDRFVVTGPLALCSMLLSVQLALVLWAQGAIADLALPALAAVAAIAVVVLALSLPILETVLCWLAKLARTNEIGTTRSTITDYQATAGLRVTYRAAWHQEGNSMHYLPDQRDDVGRFSLQTDYFERMATLLLINVAAALVAMLVCGLGGRGS